MLVGVVKHHPYGPFTQLRGVPRSFRHWLHPLSYEALSKTRYDSLVIDDASELFGNATRLSNNERARNGFEALADFDANGDRKINSGDQVYLSLRLWVDLNHDGVSQPSELKTLESAGIATILTDYNTSPRVDRNGNKYFYRGTALVIRNGHETPRAVFDVILAIAD